MPSAASSAEDDGGDGSGRTWRGRRGANPAPQARSEARTRPLISFVGSGETVHCGMGAGTRGGDVRKKGGAGRGGALGLNDAELPRARATLTRARA